MIIKKSLVEQIIKEEAAKIKKLIALKEEKKHVLKQLNELYEEGETSDVGMSAHSGIVVVANALDNLVAKLAGMFSKSPQAVEAIKKAAEEVKRGTNLKEGETSDVGMSAHSGIVVVANAIDNLIAKLAGMFSKSPQAVEAMKKAAEEVKRETSLKEGETSDVGMSAHSGIVVVANAIDNLIAKLAGMFSKNPKAVEAMKKAAEEVKGENNLNELKLLGMQVPFTLNFKDREKVKLAFNKAMGSKGTSLPSWATPGTPAYEKAIDACQQFETVDIGYHPSKGFYAQAYSQAGDSSQK